MFGFCKKPPQEPLPGALRRTERLRTFRNRSTGTITAIEIDGSSDSRAARMRLAGRFIISIILVFCSAEALLQYLGHKDGGFLACFILFWPVHAFWHPRCLERRIFTVRADSVNIVFDGQTDVYGLNEIIGVALSPVDQQRIDEERRKFRKTKNPKLMEPYSMDILLETTLGPVNLGSAFGIQDAQNIARATNAVFQFMKGRRGTGNGPVLNPAHQYRPSQAGNIPQ